MGCCRQVELDAAIRTLRTLLETHRRGAEVLRELCKSAPSMSVFHAVASESDAIVDSLELAAAGLETICAFTPDSDGPPLCPFCRMPYRPTPHTKGIVS